MEVAPFNAMAEQDGTNPLTLRSIVKVQTGAGFRRTGADASHRIGADADHATTSRLVAYEVLSYNDLAEALMLTPKS